MDNTLLGLAKKAGLLEIGGESVGHAARHGKARVILSARDAADNSKRQAAAYADRYSLIHLVLPSTKEELGAVVGRGSPGMMAILDAGLAAKYVTALAKTDPAEYEAAAQQLEAKAERIRRRRKETARQGRNKRTGRGRTINEYNV
jgi:ribosomal protein L7Ae-like RNA K-turn-binding protein